MKNPVYLSDIKREVRNDIFFDTNLEKLEQEAKEKNLDIIVGYYLDKPKFDK